MGSKTSDAHPRTEVRFPSLFVLVPIDYRTNAMPRLVNSGLSIYLLWFSSRQPHVILSVTKNYWRRFVYHWCGCPSAPSNNFPSQLSKSLKKKRMDDYTILSITLSAFAILAGLFLLVSSTKAQETGLEVTQVSKLTQKKFRLTISQSYMFTQSRVSEELL